MALTGAKATEVVAMNTLTTNLHLMLTSFYRPEKGRVQIVMEQGAFPSDRHAIDSQMMMHGLDPKSDLIEIAPREDGLHHEEDLEHYLEHHGEQVALVLWPGVQYATGQAFDLARIARATHACGALCGFDLAHAIGNIELNLHEDGADFAIWCHYKYVNAGPGAVGGCFVHEKHHSYDGPRLAGWWGHEETSRFKMSPNHNPAKGVEGWQISGPPILSTAPLLASLQMFLEADPILLRKASLALTGRLAEKLTSVAGDEIEIITPLEPHRHGAQLSLRARAGRAAGRLLFERLVGHGVIGDWREPDIIRMAPAPLYNTFDEVEQFVQLVSKLIRA
jgi:kynureninase